jgi:hypothetical protein
MLCQFGVPINDFKLGGTAVCRKVVVTRGHYSSSGLGGTREPTNLVEGFRFSRHVSIYE